MAQRNASNTALTPSQLSTYERMEQKAQREQQREGVQLVRSEKQADAATEKKLTEAYRIEQKKRFAEKTLTRGWKCDACHRMNYDERLVCGACTAVAPHAYPSGPPQDSKRPGVLSTLDAGETCIITVAGRSYRAYNSELLKQQLRPVGHKKAAAAGRGATASEGTYAPYDGDGFVGGGPPVLDGRHALNDDEDDEDEPGCPLRIVDDDDGAQEAPPPPPPPPPPAATSSSGAHQQPYTHFVSLPLGTIPSVAANVRALLGHIRAVTGLPADDAAIQSTTSTLDGVSPEYATWVGSAPASDEVVRDEGIDSSLLVTPEKLHFTVLMLRLPTRELVERAVHVLTTTVRGLLGDFLAKQRDGGAPSLRLHLAGLKTMTDTPSRTNVLYVELADHSDHGAASSATPRSDVVSLLRAVRGAFLEASLASDKDVQMGEKIHATLMNSKWRGKQSGRGGSRHVRQPAFDATRIMRLLGGVSLGVCQPTTMELSKLDGSRAASGYYAAEAVIPI